MFNNKARIICSRISWRRIEGCLKKQQNNEAVGGVGVESCDDAGRRGESGETRFTLTSHAAVMCTFQSKVSDECGLRLDRFTQLRSN